MRIKIAVTVAVALIGLSSCQGSFTQPATGVTVQQMQEYERQVKKVSEQQATVDRQMERAEQQQVRMEALVKRWESQADRYDAILHRWEQQDRNQ